MAKSRHYFTIKLNTIWVYSQSVMSPLVSTKEMISVGPKKIELIL